ncbi:MAG TPA: histidinol-phosphatase HisJ family protein [candidate division Zixibacteria bacterium]|nr:histidinol-phosphatase HisJ family protein [candidate division Zixibacteria bacterium]
MIDFHVHPDFSIDSKASIDGLLRRADELGLQAICFTTHIDLNPKRIPLDRCMRVDGRLTYLNDDAVRRYISDIRDACERTRCSVEVLTGFEFSYGRHFHDLVADFIERYRPDFHLGAIHSLDNIGITSRSEAAGYYRAVPLERALEDYVSAMEKLIDSGLFWTIAHFDAIKKYGHAFYGDALIERFEDCASELLNRMASSGVGIEVNTSSRKKGFAENYPSRRILEMARDAGVAVNSIGSDAHSEAELGFELDEAMQIIIEVGAKVGEPLKSYIQQGR